MPHIARGGKQPGIPPAVVNRLHRLPVTRRQLHIHTVEHTGIGKTRLVGKMHAEFTVIRGTQNKIRKFFAHV